MSDMAPVAAGRDTLANALPEMQRDTRRFARRQRTWLRAESGVVWVDPREPAAIRKRVEEFVPHDAMELHEGNGKRFMPLIMITTVLTLAGFAGRRVGGAARGVTLVVALLMAAQLFWAAKTGGALVYEHGAANAYTGELAEPTGEYEDEHDDDD